MVVIAQEMFEPRVDDYILTKVVPPRVGDKTIVSTENLLSSLSTDEHTFSLEVVGSKRGVTLMHRSEGNDQIFRRQLFEHFPSARIEDVPPDVDPMNVSEDEEAWTCTLKVEGEPYLPLRAYNNEVQLDHGADPMAAVIGAHANLFEEERVISRLVLKPLPRDWSEPFKRLALGGAGSHNQQQSIEEQREKSRASETEVKDDTDKNIPIIGLIAILAVGFILGYRWFQDLSALAQTMISVGGAVMGGALLVGLVMFFLRRKGPKEPDYFNPSLVSNRIDNLAYEAEIQITVVIARRVTRTPQSMGRASGIMRALIQAYKHFDHPEGSKLVEGEIRRHTGHEDYFRFLEREERGQGLFSFSQKDPEPSSVVGLHEVATMWHLPTSENVSSSIERSFTHDLAPPPNMPTEGAYVGDTTIGAPQRIMFSSDITRRHQFFIARTRMGKSTLMEHCVAYKLRQKAQGLDDDAIVVVDPHADLVQSLLELVPKGLENRIWLIDLSDPEHVPGINVLDAHIFPDRDHTCDGVIRVTKGIWENWGSRMQNILEHTIKSLHEANSHPETPREKQYTLLDGMRMLSEENFRQEVLEKVSDVYLKRYWREEFDKMRPQLRQEAVAPVQTRLAYFASSKRAREILGQRSSTLDIKQAIDNGDVLLINTAQGVAGRDVASLVGASILNLVDAVIRQQSLKPASERRGVYVVVDEMQTIPGVDFQGMLSEVGKFGGALCLVTQSLAAMNELSDSMRSTVLANIGCLVVFQVAAEDAQRLVFELGEERVSVTDITSLPAHHAYVRLTSEGMRIPTFTMRLRYPQDGHSEMSKKVRSLCGRYTKTAEEIEKLMADEAYEEMLLAEEQSASAEASFEDNGVSFEDIISSTMRQQRTVAGRARAKKRRNSRVHTNDILTGGMSAKTTIGSTGKQGGDNVSVEGEKRGERGLVEDYYGDPQRRN